MSGLDAFAAALVLLSAVFHASWNALVKVSGKPLLAVTGMMLTGTLLATPAVCLLPLPLPASWPYLGLSLVLHVLYGLALTQSYRVGDLSLVYPIARGSAPLLVAVLAASAAGEVPGAGQALGLLLVSGGIASLMLAPASGGRAGAIAAAPARALPAVVFATLTAILIAAYTVADGLGVRLSGGPASYIAWSFFLDGFPMLVIVLAARPAAVGPFVRASGRSTALAGGLAVISYGIVVWAMSRGAMAYVSCLRETSVLFAAWIGTRLLHEPFGPRRLAAAGVVVAGLLLLGASG